MQFAFRGLTAHGALQRGVVKGFALAAHEHEEFDVAGGAAQLRTHDAGGHESERFDSRAHLTQDRLMHRGIADDPAASQALAACFELRLDERLKGAAESEELACSRDQSQDGDERCVDDDQLLEDAVSFAMRAASVPRALAVRTKDTLARVQPYWDERVAPALRRRMVGATAILSTLLTVEGQP